MLSTALSNATLAGLATTYGLHEGLQAARAQIASLRFNPQVQASLFEAYLYGVHTNSGGNDYSQVKGFVEEVFGPLLDIEHAHYASQHQATAVDPSTFQDWISRLNTLCQQRGLPTPK